MITESVIVDVSQDWWGHAACKNATNTASEEWGVDGLLAPVKRCRTRQPESIVEAAFAALDEFLGDNQTVDATILAAPVHRLQYNREKSNGKRLGTPKQALPGAPAEIPC